MRQNVPVRRIRNPSEGVVPRQKGAEEAKDAAGHGEARVRFALGVVHEEGDGEEEEGEVEGEEEGEEGDGGFEGAEEEDRREDEPALDRQTGMGRLDGMIRGGGGGREWVLAWWWIDVVWGEGGELTKRKRPNESWKVSTPPSASSVSTI